MTESFIVLQSLLVWHLGRKAGSSTATEESRPPRPVRCGASDKTPRAEEGRPLGRGRAAQAPQVLSWGLVVQIVRSRKSSWARCAPLGTGRRPPRRLLALTRGLGPSSELASVRRSVLTVHEEPERLTLRAPRPPATHGLAPQWRKRQRRPPPPQGLHGHPPAQLAVQAPHAGVRVAPQVVAGTGPGPKPQMPAHCSCPGCYAGRT